MLVTMLGTGSPIPDPNRAGPATLVRAGGLNLLVDCGRGVSMRLAAAGVPGPPLLHRVLLTHLHSDHVTDFNDLLTMRWVMSPVHSPLPVSGPPGTAAFAARTVEMLRDDVGYRVAHHHDLHGEPAADVEEVTDGEVSDPVLAAAGVRVLVAPTDHRPVHPTVGYRVEHEGRSVVLAGDTVPCEGLDRLVDGADCYVQTVIRPDLIEAIGLPRLMDVRDYHSTVEQAARTAAAGGVSTLVLTHLVPAPPPGGEAEWAELAAAHFDGRIVIAADLDRIEV
jgi:ribonuclease Z